MRLQQYLNEALINIDESDINKLFGPLKEWSVLLLKSLESKENYISFVNKLKTLKTKRVEDIRIKHILSVPGKNLTRITKSESIKKAYNAYPIKKIVYGLSIGSSSYYAPQNSIILFLIDIYELLNEDFIYWDSDITDDERKKLKKVSYMNNSPIALKIDIRHELTHWIDDVLHGHFLTKTLRKAKEFQKKGNIEKALKVVSFGKEDEYLTSYEINAIINSLQTLRNNAKNWESFGLKHLFKYTAVEDMLNTYGDKFAKPFFKRMAKEGLLSKKIEQDLKKTSFREIKT